jgi:two-component system cell cycle sensor histidine kinase/response regulator CckA
MDPSSPFNKVPAPFPSLLTTIHFGHNLRSLLNVMVKCVDSLRPRLPVGAETEQALAELDGAIDSGFYVAREMLGLGWSSPAQHGVVEIDDLVTQARGVIQRIVGPDITVLLELNAPAAMVQADAVQLEWVLLNLVANSRDAMPNGGSLTIRTTTAADPNEGRDPVTTQPQEYVRLVVLDDGRGMNADVQARAFEPFITTKLGATGLGLSSVAMTVLSLRGWLHLESNERAGTQVHVYLPILGTTSREPTT